MTDMRTKSDEKCISAVPRLTKEINKFSVVSETEIRKKGDKIKNIIERYEK